MPHGDFFLAGGESGETGEIRLNDGRLILEILSAAGEEVRARVRTGGEISPRKGVYSMHNPEYISR